MAMRTEVLHTDQFHEIRLVTKKVTPTEHGFHMVGALTLVGQTRDVPIDVSVEPGVDTLRAHGHVCDQADGLRHQALQRRTGGNREGRESGDVHHRRHRRPGFGATAGPCGTIGSPFFFFFPPPPPLAEFPEARMPRTAVAAEAVDWPALPYEEWKDTLATLHLWTQIVGKIRLAQTPWTNHSWHVPLYVTSRGLTTSPIPYGDAHLRDDVRFRRSAASDRRPANGRSRVDRARAAHRRGFLSRGVRTARPALGLDVGIRTMPCEIPDAIPFEQDHEHATLRCGARDPLLAGAGAGRPGVQGVPRALHRQGQPGALLLGQLRPGGHPLLGPARAAPPGRRAEPARLGGARGVLARGEQLRVLAGRRGAAGARVLRLRVPRARGFKGATVRPRRRTTIPIWASSFCPTTRCGERRTGMRRSSTSFRAATRRPPTLAAGTGRRSRRISSGDRPRRPGFQASTVARSSAGAATRPATRSP